MPSRLCSGTRSGRIWTSSPRPCRGRSRSRRGAALTECDELVSHVANGFGVYTAVGLQQDRLFGALGVKRIPGTRSTVTATLSGTASTQVPAGSRARTTGGALFETNGDTIIGAGGTVDVLMRSVNLGPVTALAGDLTGIVTVVSGWAGITNAAAATPGTVEETDRAYRRRYLQARAANAGRLRRGHRRAAAHRRERGTLQGAGEPDRVERHDRGPDGRGLLRHAHRGGRRGRRRGARALPREGQRRNLRGRVRGRDAPGASPRRCCSSG